MDKYKCPAAAVNKQAHAKFIQTFGELRRKVRSEGVGATDVLKVKRALGDWLVGHIRKIDTQLQPCTKRSRDLSKAPAVQKQHDSN